MTDWNPHLYLKYGSLRTRPAIDLAARIDLGTPGRIVDLGCGSGTSTAVLKTRWPNARITGLDSSTEMLARARAEFPDMEWVQADITGWNPAERFDLIFANAVFQWIHDLPALLPVLIGFLTQDGILAFQVPYNQDSPYYQSILRVSRRSRWNEVMEGARNPLTHHPAAFCYDLLGKSCPRIDIWETRYYQVMDSRRSILDWVSATGLRPYMAALPAERDREEFKKDLLAEYETAYPARVDGKVLFPFNRQFVVAYKDVPG